MSKLFNAYCRVYQKALFVGSQFLDWRKPELLTGAGAVKKLPLAVKEKGVSKVVSVKLSDAIKIDGSAE